MDIREIELGRQEANILFKKQRINKALEIYKASLAKATAFIEPGVRNDLLEEQLALLTYNISIIYYKKKNFPRSLAFGLESLKYDRNDRTLHRLCMTYLRLGMIKEYAAAYDQMVNKPGNSEVTFLLNRMKLGRMVIERHLKSCLSLEMLCKLSEEIASGRVVPADTLHGILQQGESILLGCENIVYAESRGEVMVFGDTHGQYFDVVSILNKVFNTDRMFVFNGDYVDRGANSVENFMLLLSLKILFPERVHLTRGNHELSDLNRVYGLYDEVKRKYPFNSESVYQGFQEVFRALPISIVVNERVFITHGGLPGTLVKLEDLQGAYRMTDSYTDELLKGFLWSDPDEISGTEESKRRAGVVFGSDITEEFLRHNGLDVLIRSHQAVENGYKAQHGGRTVTIFSAPDYEGIKGPGSYLILNPSICDEGEVVEVSPFTRYRVVRFNKSSGNEALRL